MKTVTLSARVDKTLAFSNGILRPQIFHKLTFELDQDTGNATLIKIDGRRLADDPLAKPVRKPTSYESIIRDLEIVSMTCLPAILSKVILECGRRNVFKEGGLLEFVKSKLAPTGLWK